MAKTKEQRLLQQLDERDEEVAELREKLADAESRLEAARGGWALPRLVPDDPWPCLPLPRLEMEWRPDRHDGWRRYTVEYRLVTRHLIGEILTTPLGLTTCSRSTGEDPRVPRPDNPPGVDAIAGALPYRDGAHSMHDAAHLRLPLYLLMPDGPLRYDLSTGYEHQRQMGTDHRREGEAQKAGTT